jgi:hypothetical protein
MFSLRQYLADSTPAQGTVDNNRLHLRTGERVSVNLLMDYEGPEKVNCCSRFSYHTNSDSEFIMSSSKCIVRLKDFLNIALCSLMLKHVLLVGEMDAVGVLELGHVGEDQEGTTWEKREVAD